MSACTPWDGPLTRDGYGVGPYGMGAHRWTYERKVGPIPEGLVIHHLCRNRACVNPDHLEAVTVRRNVMDSDNFAAVNANKTHCKHGHEFTPENTYTSEHQIVRKGGTVWTGTRRQCRRCNAEAAARYDARRRATRNAA